MNNQPKPRKCAQCPEIFTPRRIGNSLKLTKTCGNAACELDYAQNVQPMPVEVKIVKSKPRVAAKPKAKKQKTVGKLRLELWDEMSLYIKLLYSHDGVWCYCYTCDKPIQIGTINCQGGHAFSKAANGNLYFDERAVRPQCAYCNCGEEGNHYIFNERLKQEIGMAAWTDMYENRKNLFKENRKWYLEKIRYYRDAILELRRTKFGK